MGRRMEREVKRVRKQEQERVEGPSISFYSESGTPGYCQITVGRSLDEMPRQSNLSLYFLMKSGNPEPKTFK